MNLTFKQRPIIISDLKRYHVFLGNWLKEIEKLKGSMTRANGNQFYSIKKSEKRGVFPYSLLSYRSDRLLVSLAMPRATESAKLMFLGDS